MTAPDRSRALRLLKHYVDHRRFEAGRADGLGRDPAPNAQALAHELRTSESPFMVKLRSRLHDLLSPHDWENLDELVEFVQGDGFAAELARAERDAAQRDAAEREEAERRREEASRRRAAEKAAHEEALRAGRDALAADFLGAEESAEGTPASHLTSEDWAGLRGEIARGWVQETLNLDGRLDDEQAAAVGVPRRDVKLIARAGSGKTRVLTARALFLQQFCGVDPQEILLLAFNKKAASEMRTRILEHSDAPPHVMTFHALAHALVKPAEELLFDDPSGAVLKHTRAMQEATRALVEDPAGLAVVKRAMSLYFRQDLEPLIAGGLTMGADDGLAFRRSLTQESLKGDFVKSFGEKRIANALFENDVAYQYEAPHRWADGSPYFPDFTIKHAKVAIEYFGMAGRPEYDRLTEEKAAYWAARSDWTLISLFPTDVVADDDEAFMAEFVSRLHAVGVTTRRLSNAEVWAKCRDRATDRFSSAVAHVILRARAEGIKEPELRRRGARLDGESDQAFVNAACAVMRSYEQICTREGKDDFSGLIWRAVNAVRAGQTRFTRDQGREVGDLSRLRFVLVDELQDLTPGFHALLEALLTRAPGATVFGVGDDWQAITRYAGAKPELFTDLPGPVAAGTRMHLTTNYRSCARIVAAGNDLMEGHGRPADVATEDPGVLALVHADKVAFSPAETREFGADYLTPALLRIVEDRTRQGLSVCLLCRNQTLPHSYPVRTPDFKGFATNLRPLLDDTSWGLLTSSTIHQYKGKEADVVVIVDAVAGRHPFLHPEWFFSRVLGDSEDRVRADERRLFYVALTRGRSETILLSISNHESEFLDEIGADGTRGAALVSALSVPERLRKGHEVLVVHGGYAIRRSLSEMGFTLDRNAGAWWFMATPDDLAALAKHPELAGSDYVIERQSAGMNIRRR